MSVTVTMPCLAKAAKAAGTDLLIAGVRPEHCEAGEPLTFREVDVVRLGPGERFDLAAWHSEQGIRYRLSAEGGALSSSRGAVY